MVYHITISLTLTKNSVRFVFPTKFECLYLMLGDWYWTAGGQGDVLHMFWRTLLWDRDGPFVGKTFHCMVAITGFLEWNWLCRSISIWFQFWFGKEIALVFLFNVFRVELDREIECPWYSLICEQLSVPLTMVSFRNVSPQLVWVCVCREQSCNGSVLSSTPALLFGLCVRHAVGFFLVTHSVHIYVKPLDDLFRIGQPCYAVLSQFSFSSQWDYGSSNHLPGDSSGLVHIKQPKT